MPLNALDWLLLASQLGQGEQYSEPGWGQHEVDPRTQNYHFYRGFDNGSRDSDTVTAAEQRARLAWRSRWDPTISPPGTPEFEDALRQVTNQERVQNVGAANRLYQPRLPSANALFPMIPGVTGLGGLWQQMQQGGSGPFGDTLPPPYGPYGPGRPFMVPDENMGSR